VQEQAVRRVETSGYGEPSRYLEWGYDEVELVQEQGAAAVRHSILFTNGVELVIVFTDFDFARLRPLAEEISAQSREGSWAR